MARIAQDIMTVKVVSTTPDATAAEVAALLSEHHISGVPVVSEWQIVGIITEADLLAAPRDATTRELMTTDVISVRPTTPIVAVAKVLANQGIRRVPVMDAQRNLVGIVSRADIVAAMAAGE